VDYRGHSVHPLAPRGFVLNIGGGLIHILVVLAIIVVLYRVITGRKPV